MGRGVEVGEDGMGGECDGMGACACSESVCGDGVEVWVAVEFRVWIGQGKSFASHL